jgi:hypothetical protein
VPSHFSPGYSLTCGTKYKKIVLELVLLLELDCRSLGGQYLPSVNPRRSRGSL